jgi:hypothetical protein
MNERHYEPGSRRVETRPQGGGWVGLIVADYSAFALGTEERVEFRTGVFPEQEDARAAAERERDMRRAVRPRK